MVSLTPRTDVGFSIVPRNPKRKMSEGRKVLVLGDCGVGKTRLLRRMAGLDSISNCDEATSPAVLQGDYLSKMAVVEGAEAPVKVHLWDTAGQEQFGAARLPSAFFCHAQAAIVVYDVTDRRSFDGILQWIAQLLDYRRGPGVPAAFSLALVGHKCDAPVASRQVHAEEGRRLATVIGAAHFSECSAKHDVNVRECFDAVAAQLVAGSHWDLEKLPLFSIALPSQLPSLATQPPLLEDVSKPCGSALRVATDGSIPCEAKATIGSPSVRPLVSKGEAPVLGMPYMGTLAALLAMPMVLLWLEDDAVLRWAAAAGIP
ncbi:hypothetical protein BBJ28_00008993 [Nothophytophthora sp. Chile5]|nr:hypothetical protein BBJ28_00008993 [Nothophytophthora sp. Chile5]